MTIGNQLDGELENLKSQWENAVRFADTVTGRLGAIESRLDALEQGSPPDTGQPKPPPPSNLPNYVKVFDSRVHQSRMRPHLEGAGRITENGGGWTYRSNKGRAEHQGMHTARVNTDTVFIYRDKMVIPPGVFKAPGTWRIGGQLHRGSDHPPVTRQIDEKRNLLKYTFYMGKGFFDPWSEPLTPFMDSLLSFTTMAIWRDDDKGRVQVSLNGDILFDYRGPTIYGNTTQIYPKYGAYDGSSGDTELWFTDIEVYEASGWDERFHTAL